MQRYLVKLYTAIFHNQLITKRSKTMTYNQNDVNQNYCECEFTVPIKLNVPITINSQVHINPVAATKQKLPIFMEPDLILEPEVRAKAPVCYPQNGYENKHLKDEDVMQSVEIK